MNTQEPSVDPPHPGEPTRFAEIITAAHARIDGDVLQVDSTTWALHGVIAYDGEVLLAEFDTPGAASDALHHIPTDNNRNGSIP